MATQTIKLKFQFRRDSTENWLLNKNVIPADGEPCFDRDLNILKIGNGVDTYENLKPIAGVSVDADGKSLVFEDGVLKLFGFDAAEVGAQPRKTADNKIEWVVPSTETVEGLQSTVAGLQSDVTNLQTNVTEIQQIVMSSDEGTGTLLDRVEGLESKMDGTGDGTVDAKIDAKIEAFASVLTPDDGKVNTLLELINYVETHGQKAIDMAAEIKDLQDLVGQGTVDSRIAAAVANKVTVEEGKSLVSDTLIAKLETIEERAQVNKIEGVKVGSTLLEIVDKVVTIPVGAGLKGSDEIEVADDGSLHIKSISFDKIAQAEGSVLVMDGGSAV
jgi:hypothetical protein